MMVTAGPETHQSDRQIITRIGATIAVGSTVIGFLAAVLISWWVGLLVLIVVAAGAWFGGAAPRPASAENRALRRLGPARELGESVAELRFANLVEGIAPTAGIPRPRCLVIEDAALNALALGRSARTGQVVVTSALLDQLSRMEL